MRVKILVIVLTSILIGGTALAWTFKDRTGCYTIDNEFSTKQDWSSDIKLETCWINKKNYICALPSMGGIHCWEVSHDKN